MDYGVLSKNRELMLKERLCVPDVLDIKKELMKKAHHSSFTTHLKTIKMYQDLKEHFWRMGMKISMVTYVSKCLNYQKPKVGH